MIRNYHKHFGTDYCGGLNGHFLLVRWLRDCVRGSDLCVTILFHVNSFNQDYEVIFFIQTIRHLMNVLLPSLFITFPFLNLTEKRQCQKISEVVSENVNYICSSFGSSRDTTEEVRQDKFFEFRVFFPPILLLYIRVLTVKSRKYQRKKRG